MAADGRRQIHEDVELLKLTGACDGQQARDGAFAVLATIAKGDLAPLNGMAQGAFRHIVRRLDPLLVHERKEVRMLLKQGTSEIARIDVGDVDGPFSQREERLLEGTGFRDQLLAGEGAAAHPWIAPEPMPEPEQPPLQGGGRRRRRR